MTAQEFQRQIGRLVETYGKEAYATERCKLIWREVRDFDAAWWEQTVDHFIGDCRFPPLMPEIREKASFERERIYRTEKAAYRKQADARYEAGVTMAESNPDQIRRIMAMIRASMGGKSL